MLLHLIQVETLETHLISIFQQLISQGYAKLKDLGHFLNYGHPIHLQLWALLSSHASSKEKLSEKQLSQAIDFFGVLDYETQKVLLARHPQLIEGQNDIIRLTHAQ
ncbi:hypothetical protein FGO68_gene5566 [Halteria grandinella]|uniref:Uncharacterized protein n=1 Tax=Halteria grandinella TaxID=5974 RepID=A0A8J8T959_HALGN|nr:hypothetical protein FGO68_gene5566 [Halteria grandinella]